MDTIERVVRLYLAESGTSPFETWFDGLADAHGRARVLARIARLRSGNPGESKALGDSVFELRVHCGPGYRIYFGQEGCEIVILLIGGTKGTQGRDIKQAKEYWYDYEKSRQAKDF